MIPLDVAALASPEFFPMAIDPSLDRVLMVRLGEQIYRDAGFLDERLFVDHHSSVWAPFALVEEAAASMPADCDFIFHIGHVGSTLLSRLLAAEASIFPVREPAILRAMARTEPDSADGKGPWAIAEFDRRLDVILRLLSRVPRRGVRSLIKATSFVGEIALRLVRISGSARALLLFVPPQIYIASILAGDASRAELPELAVTRRARLARRLSGSGRWDDRLSLGQMAAMGWICELMGLAELAEALPDRVMWLDFERLLANRGIGLSVALRHLRADAEEQTVEAMLASEEWRRYSKATTFEFSPSIRNQVLNKAFSDHAMDIREGVAWLDALFAEQPEALAAARLAAAARAF